MSLVLRLLGQGVHVFKSFDFYQAFPHKLFNLQIAREQRRRECVDIIATIIFPELVLLESKISSNSPPSSFCYSDSHCLHGVSTGHILDASLCRCLECFFIKG